MKMIQHSGFTWFCWFRGSCYGAFDLGAGKLGMVRECTAMLRRTAHWWNRQRLWYYDSSPEQKTADRPHNMTIVIGILSPLLAKPPVRSHFTTDDRSSLQWKMIRHGRFPWFRNHQGGCSTAPRRDGQLSPPSSG